MNKATTQRSTRDRGTALVWLRRDLRLTDNAALSMALECADRVHLAFVFDTEILDTLTDRADRRVEFIHRAVSDLNARLSAFGARLRVRHGVPATEISTLAQELSADIVIAARDYEPAAVKRDQQVAQTLSSAGRRFKLVKDHVIFERDQLLTGTGTPYTVFTHYKRKWLAQFQPALATALPYTLTRQLVGTREVTPIPSLSALGFSPTNLESLGINATPEGAKKLLTEFSKRIGRYDEQRNFPAVKGPSYLSVHLRFGTLSIRQAVGMATKVLESATRSVAKPTDSVSGAQTWLTELIWRDFYFQILHHFPHVETMAFKSAYNNIKWEDSEPTFEAWCEGRTGYPLVDAAMAQINSTGYMHNRLRMVVASFLTKDLGISWQRGERYFARQLIDFDLAANNGGWQWAASSGCDAQPYFRIFNPVTQSQKFDPKGVFIRKYLPQLAPLSDKQIHAPWLVPSIELAALGIKLGRDYPAPIVDHAQARTRTLRRYEVVKSAP